jgi:hypothetical protein
MRTWTEFTWLRIGSIDWFLWAPQQIFGFHKMQMNFLAIWRVSACEELLRFMQSVFEMRNADRQLCPSALEEASLMRPTFMWLGEVLGTFTLNGRARSLAGWASPPAQQKEPSRSPSPGTMHTTSQKNQPVRRLSCATPEPWWRFLI